MIGYPACACEACKFREPCHQAFGADDNGWGYYPLNETAVERLVGLVSRHQSTKERFDPRMVVREVIRSPLERAQEELADDRFPSAASLRRSTRKDGL